MFELQLNFSPAECVQRLGLLSKRRSIKVEISKQDEGLYEFTIRKWAFFNVAAQMQGQIIGKDNQTVLLARVSMSLHLRLMLFLSSIVAVIIIATDALSLGKDWLPSAVFMGGWLLLVWGVWSYWKTYLKNQVINAFPKAGLK
jgi:hypothetical protein